MIFGTTPDQRVPFRRPPQASFYTPRIPAASFYSHLQPFSNVLPALAAQQTRLPSPQADMHPGVVRFDQRGGGHPNAPAVPGANGVNGFGRGGSAFGAAGSPYRVMRSGMFPGIHANVSNVRNGVNSAGAMIRRMTPGAYNANTPAGSYEVE